MAPAIAIGLQVALLVGVLPLPALGAGLHSHEEGTHAAGLPASDHDPGVDAVEMKEPLYPPTKVPFWPTGLLTVANDTPGNLNDAHAEGIWQEYWSTYVHSEDDIDKVADHVTGQVRSLLDANDWHVDAIEPSWCGFYGQWLGTDADTVSKYLALNLEDFHIWGPGNESGVTYVWAYTDSALAGAEDECRNTFSVLQNLPSEVPGATTSYPAYGYLEGIAKARPVFYNVSVKTWIAPIDESSDLSTQAVRETVAKHESVEACKIKVSDSEVLLCAKYKVTPPPVDQDLLASGLTRVLGLGDTDIVHEPRYSTEGGVATIEVCYQVADAGDGPSRRGRRTSDADLGEEYFRRTFDRAASVLKHASQPTWIASSLQRHLGSELLQGATPKTSHLLPMASMWKGKDVKVTPIAPVQGLWQVAYRVSDCDSTGKKDMLSFGKEFAASHMPHEHLQGLGRALALTTAAAAVFGAIFAGFFVASRRRANAMQPPPEPLMQEGSASE